MRGRDKSIFDYDPGQVGCFVVICFFIVLAFWKFWELLVQLILSRYGAC